MTSCQERYNDSKSTMDWINVVDTLKQVSNVRDIDLQKSQLLKSILDKGDQAIVKIGDRRAMQREYDMGAKFRNMKGFVKYICYFECLDDFRSYFGKQQPKQLCRGTGDSMGIIIMPYFPLGSISLYAWTKENVHILRSCIKHSCLSIICAFTEKGVVHGDFHAGNVVLKTTKQSSITYDSLQSHVLTYGFRTWIMDFEYTKTREELTPRFAVAQFFHDLLKFFTLLPTFIRNIDTRSTFAFSTQIGVWASQSHSVQTMNSGHAQILCKLIDESIDVIDS